MHYKYYTKNTCSQVINFDLDGDVVTNIEFTGGCNGNLKAISKILDGWTVSQIETKLRGVECGLRKTSCSDQLSRAVRDALDKQNAQDSNEVSENMSQIG